MQTHNWELWTSSCSLVVDTEDANKLEAAKTAVREVCQEVDRAINRFDPSSEISLIHYHGLLETEVSDTLANILRETLAAYSVSAGAFDPRVGEQLENAGYGITSYSLTIEDGEATAAIVEENEKLTDLVSIEGNLLKLKRRIYLDLTSLGKAYAARTAAQQAANAAGASVLVSLGGDIATAGPLRTWTIDVQDLDTDPASTIDLINNGAIATSSTQKRRWTQDGEAWHHIIDPRTGLSAEPRIKTASVVTGDAVLANALSTSAIVWGYDAEAYLNQLPFPYRLVTSDDQIITHNWPE